MLSARALFRSPAPSPMLSLASSTLRTPNLHVPPRMLSSPAPATSQDHSKPYEDIPGPKGYPFIGTALDYRHDRFRISKVMKKRFEQYGPIYREKIFPGFPEQVILCDPKDIETVFRADGEWPDRPAGGDTFEELLKEAKISTLGLFLAQGEQWHKMRSPISKFTMVPRKVAEYHEDFNNITLDLLKNIELKKHPDTAMLTDVPSHFFNWSFESAAFFGLGKRLGALNQNGATPESKEFIATVSKFFVAINELLFAVPLYKIYRTKAWKNVVTGQITMNRLAMKMISEKLAEIEEADKKALEAASGEEEAPEKVDFITYLVHSGKMSIEEVSMSIIDILSAGVETTSYTLAWALYCLANNPEAQEKLRSEIQRVVGSEQIVAPTHVSKMTYLRNVLKETQRLFPLAGVNQRKLQSDVVLSGYRVPKGTELTMPQTLIGRMPELFSEPDNFLPERWDKENKDKLPSMFAYLPFGFGARMCAGRRIAELELHIALTHLIREYKVDYLDKEPMGYIQNFLVKPERELQLTFTKVNS